MTPVALALWVIESRYAGPLTLDGIAQAAGLSRFGLARAFLHRTGQTVMGYCRARRLSEAAKKLAAGAPDILGLALDHGYGSHEAFSHAFRDQFGLTPEQVRARRSLQGLAIQEPLRMLDTPKTPLAPPRIEDRPAMLVAGLKQFFTYTEIPEIPQLWRRFNPFFGTFPTKPGGAYGVCLNDPERSDGFDYLACVEAPGTDDLPRAFASYRLPAATYAVFRHEGHVSGVNATCAAIFSDGLPQSGLRPAEGPIGLVEHYDEGFDPVTGLGGLDLWVPVTR